jgi:hypothetical protein
MNEQVIHEYLSYRPGLAPAMVAVPPERRTVGVGVDTSAGRRLMEVEDSSLKVFGL